jgi:hypothetical protein
LDILKSYTVDTLENGGERPEINFGGDLGKDGGGLLLGHKIFDGAFSSASLGERTETLT